MNESTKKETVRMTIEKNSAHHTVLQPGDVPARRRPDQLDMHGNDPTQAHAGCGRQDSRDRSLRIHGAGQEPRGTGLHRHREDPPRPRYREGRMPETPACTT